jgi:hypothetical protein
LCGIVHKGTVRNRRITLIVEYPAADRGGIVAKMQFATLLRPDLMYKPPPLSA